MRKNSLKQFYYLLNLEVWKSLKIAMPIFLITIILRIASLTYTIHWMLRSVNNNIKTLGSVEKVLKEYGYIGLSELYSYNSNIYIGLLYLGVLLVAIYSLYIWIKEYRGSNKTIYSLLNLPINKKYIILSKFLTCIILWVSFLATYLLGIIIDMFLVKVMIPKEFLFQQDLFTILDNDFRSFNIFNIKNLIFNGSISISINTIACTMILIAFVFILLKKSYGVKGAIYGIILGLLVLYQYEIPDKLNLFAEEKLTYIVCISFLISLIAFNYSNYLLHKKVHI